MILGQGLGWLTLAGLVVSGAGVTLATRAPRPPAAPGGPASGRWPCPGGGYGAEA